MQLLEVQENSSLQCLSFDELVSYCLLQSRVPSLFHTQPILIFHFIPHILNYYNTNIKIRLSFKVNPNHDNSITQTNASV